LESCLYSSSSHLVRTWWEQDPDPEFTVSNTVFFIIIINWQISYRQVPTFGRDTIRKFDANVSAMKKLAARDWEDLLQVCNYFFLWLNLMQFKHSVRNPCI